MHIWGLGGRNTEPITVIWGLSLRLLSLVFTLTLWVTSSSAMTLNITHILILQGLYLHRDTPPLSLHLPRFLGQGLNQCPSSYPSCCSDNTGSFTCCARRELHLETFFEFHIYPNSLHDISAQMSNKHLKLNTVNMNSPLSSPIILLPQFSSPV